MRAIASFVLAAAFCAALPAQAETYQVAAAAYCEKARACIWQQIRTNPQMSEADRSMIMGNMDQMCANLQSAPMVPFGHPTHTMAAACMRSMANLDCGGILQPAAGGATPECIRYSRAGQ